MLEDVKSLIRESSDTLLEDALGLLALIVILFGTLLLPSFF